MNSLEKDNIIDKAICCSGTLAKQVADMYLNGHPCADKEFQKLFLLTSYIETLGCYQADVETTTYTLVPSAAINAEFEVTIPCETWEAVLASNNTALLTVNGVETYVLGDDITTFEEAIESLLDDEGFTYVVGVCSEGNLIISVEADCDTTQVVFALHTSSGAPPVVIETDYTGVVTTAGSCSTNTIDEDTTVVTYTNCLTEDEADNIATQISKLCNLCDEH